MVVRTRTLGTQSIYRETDAQTDTWSPPYRVAEGAHPEVLQVVEICKSKGLPVTESDVVAIEKMRQKKLLEDKLPPPTDEFCVNLRVQLSNAMEFEEWRQREEQIKDLQAKRLELVKAALEEREALNEKLNQTKIERVRAMCLEWRDRGLDEVQQRRLKVVRQTDRERRKLQDRLYPPDRSLVHQHFDQASTLFAPFTRDGHVPETRTAKIDVQPLDLQSFNGLQRLEKDLMKTKRHIFDHIPPDYQNYSELTKSKASRSKYLRIDKALRETYELLDKQAKVNLGPELTMQTGAGLQTGGLLDGDLTLGQGLEGFATQPRSGLKTTTLLEEAEPVQQQAPQPTVNADEEEEHQALLLLQRVLRGRAVQNEMVAGMQTRLALIYELRAQEKLRKAAALRPPQEEEVERLELTESAAANALLEAVTGQIVSEALDNLSKELTRFEEARRVAAMAKLAERERRARQAGEGGRRQAEELLRQSEDQLFRQVMGANHATVDSYLETILSTTIERKARAEALTEAKLRAEVINVVVDELEEAEVEPHTAVRELVASFLLPHAKREDVKRRVQREQHRFALAARAAAEAAIEKTMGDLKIPPAEEEQQDDDE